MTTALIGYTGFVGTTLMSQTQFDCHYNSKNIQSIRGQKFSLVVCAAAPAVKWKANQEPEQDLQNIQALMEHLAHIEADEFILISTVDVYKNPVHVDEATEIDAEQLEPYGKHRFLLEQFAKKQFRHCTIIRLPGLFGKGLKKNVIYDFIHSNCLHLTHHQSIFQFYDMSRLWSDIQVVREANVPLINFSTEPVAACEIAQNCFHMDFTTVTKKAPVNYDMGSLHSGLFHAEGKYMLTKDEVFEGIRIFARWENATDEARHI